MQEKHNPTCLSPDNPGSAYPSPSRHLARRWSTRHESPGLRGIAGAGVRGLHAWLTRVQIEQHRPQIRFVFLTGVMRSGSSMLSQILCSHPSIIGFGETHTSYSSDESFIELIRRNLWANHAWRVREAMYFDKVLHPELIPDISLLAEMPIDWVVLRRSGEPCVQSMMRTLGMSADHSCAYFEYQWGMIADWIGVLMSRDQTRIAEVSYESLVDSPEETLASLSRALGLQAGLSAEYRVQKGTDRAGASDPSGNFRKGRVQQTQHERLTINPEILERLKQQDHLNKQLAERIRERASRLA